MGRPCDEPLLRVRKTGQFQDLRPYGVSYHNRTDGIWGLINGFNDWFYQFDISLMDNPGSTISQPISIKISSRPLTPSENRVAGLKTDPWDWTRDLAG
jgi:hypothetical protein